MALALGLREMGKLKIGRKIKDLGVIHKTGVVSRVMVGALNEQARNQRKER